MLDRSCENWNSWSYVSTRFVERERRREKGKEVSHDAIPNISAKPISPGLDFSASATPFGYLLLFSLNLRLAVRREFHECWFEGIEQFMNYRVFCAIKWNRSVLCGYSDNLHIESNYARLTGFDLHRLVITVNKATEVKCR